MSFIKSKHFYQAYFLEFWSHKLSLLNNSFSNIDQIYPSISSDLPKSTQDHFNNYLKVEVHATYFSLIETLFTLIYLLKTGKEESLWCRLGKTTNNIFRKLESMAGDFEKNNFHLLDRTINVNSKKSALFIDFLFFRGIEIKNQDLRNKSHNNIKHLISEFAKDYLNRSSHNAIKHSMHAIPQKFTFSTDETIPELNESVSFEDSILYFNKALDNRKMKIVIEKTDFTRDYNRSCAIFCLISNLIKTRERLFFGLKKFTLYPFVEDDVETVIDWKDDPKFKSIEIEYFEKDICN